MEDRTQAPAASPALRRAFTACPHRLTRDAAACLVRRQRRVPLSRPVLRRAAFPACRRARHGVAAHRHRRAGLRAADPAVADASPAPTARRGCCCLAFGACLALMNCSFYLALDRLPISPGRGDRIRRHDRRRAGRRCRSPRNLAALARRRHRHLAADRRQMVERSYRPVLGLPERRAVRRLHRARPPRRARRRRRRHRRPRRGHGDRLPRS